MGFFMRKSFGKGPFRATISTKGVSASVGYKGARVGYYASHNKRLRKSTRNTKSTNDQSKRYENNNMLSRFNLNPNELELFDFIVNNHEKLGDVFDMHGVSCAGKVASNSCFNGLYNKGLLKKPSRGKFSLNIELLEQLADEKRKELEQLEDEKRRSEERKIENRKQRRKMLACVCRACFIPMIVFGVLVAFVEPDAGIGSIIIGIIEFIYSHKYFKEHKDKK